MRTTEISDVVADVIEGLGEKIREARKENGISQKRFARLVGCSPGMISRLENDVAGVRVCTLISALRVLSRVGKVVLP